MVSCCIKTSNKQVSTWEMNHKLLANWIKVYTRTRKIVITELIDLCLCVNLLRAMHFFFTLEWITLICIFNIMPKWLHFSHFVCLFVQINVSTLVKVCFSSLFYNDEIVKTQWKWNDVVVFCNQVSFWCRQQFSPIFTLFIAYTPNSFSLSVYISDDFYLFLCVCWGIHRLTHTRTHSVSQSVSIKWHSQTEW